jgi:hypothetical protein
MIKEKGLTALIKLEDDAHTLDQIKRMVLFFDHVEYILPEMNPVIKESLERGKSLSQASFVQKRPDGSLDLSAFNYFRDSAKMFQSTLDNLSSELRETVLEFEEAGVMSDSFKIHLHDQSEENRSFDKIKSLIASMDVSDGEFIRLSETTPEDFDIFSNVTSVTLVSETSPKEEFTLLTFKEPPAITDSLQLSDILYKSHIYGHCPVFLNARHREEIQYRYSQFLKGLHVVQELDYRLVSPDSFAGRFGEVTFRVANGIFSSEAIRRKSARDILRYRNSMDGARRKYLSNDLMDLTALAKDNPWDASLKEELDKYIVGKLNHDMALLDDEAQRIWDKMFGALAVRVSEIGRSSFVGGGAAGIIGQLVPNATTWELVLIGAIAGLAKESPKLVQTFIDTIVDLRQKKRNAISYLANFK